jgi:hypothetical protein
MPWILPGQVRRRASDADEAALRHQAKRQALLLVGA